MARNAPKVYRSGNARRLVGKILISVLVVVLVFALIAFFGFRKFIAYTDTGKLYLNIPWLYGYMEGPPAVDDLAPYLTTDTSPFEEEITAENDTPADSETETE